MTWSWLNWIPPIALTIAVALFFLIDSHRHKRDMRRYREESRRRFEASIKGTPLDPEACPDCYGPLHEQPDGTWECGYAGPHVRGAPVIRHRGER